MKPTPARKKRRGLRRAVLGLLVLLLLAVAGVVGAGKLGHWEAAWTEAALEPLPGPWREKVRPWIDRALEPLPGRQTDLDPLEISRKVGGILDEVEGALAIEALDEPDAISGVSRARDLIDEGRGLERSAMWDRLAGEADAFERLLAARGSRDVELWRRLASELPGRYAEHARSQAEQLEAGAELRELAVAALDQRDAAAAAEALANGRSERPDLDWSAVESRLDELRRLLAAIDAGDSGALEQLAAGLKDADYREQAEEEAARLALGRSAQARRLAEEARGHLEADEPRQASRAIERGRRLDRGAADWSSLDARASELGDLLEALRSGDAAKLERLARTLSTSEDRRRAQDGLRKAQAREAEALSRRVRSAIEKARRAKDTRRIRDAAQAQGELKALARSTDVDAELREVQSILDELRDLERYDEALALERRASGAAEKEGVWREYLASAQPRDAGREQQARRRLGALMAERLDDTLFGARAERLSPKMLGRLGEQLREGRAYDPGNRATWDRLERRLDELAR